MAVLRFEHNVLAQIHGAYTAKYAETGFDIIGTDGAIRSRDVTGQHARGQLYLRTTDGEQEIAVEHENLYHRALAVFNAALRGEGRPAATGEDGVRSLAAALAILESARTGSQVEIRV